MGTGVLDIAASALTASEGEPSKIPFYVAGGVLAGWAVLVSVLGLRQPDFPGTPARARVVMAISGVLVLAATSMAVATSGKAVKRTERHAAAPPAAAPAPPAPAPGRPPGAPAAPVPPAPSAPLALAADPGGQLRFDQSQLRARAGKVTIRLANSSPVPHNVTIERAGRALATSQTVTASNTSVSTTLTPGSYSFYCSVDSHRQAGMQGTLTVG